ncbi:enoyl-CoA hydratase-related protein [Aldersonia sp. NBC_00410]|uniref:enoyl-CoA hydratase-related protein n=1 Tax=Aldersonia sp. NBC_00410 TaxID=2975954 RepID=UPI00224D1705|nr:enoyl-CoA hydratase-related protein [Aldersonia sp. NBC_00410]MCX5045368.1 enoyl-CoA hydratase-related protein [Aldersonia sp. NBC_00410]
MSVLVEQQGSVLVVTLNRPDQRNALDAATMSGIGRAFAAAETDDGIAAIVLTGAGDRAFCAGLDLKAFAGTGRAPLPVDGPGLDVLLSRTYPKPVVAAANGSAFAAGFELLLACDLIVAADHALFGIPEVKRGLVAAGGGISHLPRRIPLAVALELGLTGEPIDAERAYALGLVNRVVPGPEVGATALRMAETIAANAPLAVRFTKQHMHAAVSGNDDARRAMHDGLPRILASADAGEGAQAFAQRRAPVWAGR